MAVLYVCVGNMKCISNEHFIIFCNQCVVVPCSNVSKELNASIFKVNELDEVTTKLYGESKTGRLYRNNLGRWAELSYERPSEEAELS